jgi:FixJ family two-component response regulator
MHDPADHGRPHGYPDGQYELDEPDPGTHPEATIFVVDSDALTRASVCNLVRSMNLRFEGYVSGREFLEEYRPNRSGCLIAEVRIPDISGLEIQRQLASKEAPLPVIFLSAFATVPIVARAMQAGAVDFLEKPPRDQELWESIQEALHLDTVRRENLSSRQERRRRLSRLSLKERRVLSLLAEGKTRRSIASEMDLSVRTVELWRARAMKKLEIENHADLLRFAIMTLETLRPCSDDASADLDDIGRT